MEFILKVAKRLIPDSLFSKLQPHYHKALVHIAATIYRNPSKSLYVIGVTGTKGKSSTTEIMFSILQAAGKKAALASTIHFQIDEEVEPNLYKMTVPGRFFLQKFMRKAVNAGCTHMVVELTSEAAVQSRHEQIELDALIFTNLTPEHIESHGSFENYKNAKLKIRDRLSASKKNEKAAVSNSDDEHGEDFLDANVSHKIPYGKSDIDIRSDYPRIEFKLGEDSFISPLQGEFNVYNILACVKLAKQMGIEISAIQKGLANLLTIPGRVQYVDAGQDFPVVVDYAHTIDSLTQFYESFPQKNKICVLGNCGGGRDSWKRPEMAKVAEKYCQTVVLTNEDPYDEDPMKILHEMEQGMEGESEIILDRREAIAFAVAKASSQSIVLITGKGTDPYIMGANGRKEKWSDAEVAREELEKL